MRNILIICMLFLLVSCAVNNQVAHAIYGAVMKKSFKDTCNKEQFDSVCLADTLPNDLTKWKRMLFRDFESRKGENIYLFIKKLGKGEKIYRVEKIGSNFRITKREVK